jgi:4-hydroxybenzoate polyprenyltransferase
LKLFNIQLVLAIFSFIAVSFFNQLYAYLIGVLLIVISIVISYKELDKRLNLKNLFAETLQKYKSK